MYATIHRQINGHRGYTPIQKSVHVLLAVQIRITGVVLALDFKADVVPTPQWSGVGRACTIHRVHEYSPMNTADCGRYVPQNNLESDLSACATGVEIRKQIIKQQ